MEKPKVRISVRNLVEFILRSGDLDNSSGTSRDKEAMLKGGRLHRKIQRSMKGDYQAEVSLKGVFPREGYDLIVEGRADGIMTEADGTVHASTAHRSFRFTEPVQGGLCIPKQETPRKCTVYAIDPAGQMLVGDVTV